MKEPTFGEMVDGIAKGIVEVLTDRGTLGSPVKSLVEKAIAEGVMKAMKDWLAGTGDGIRTAQMDKAIRDGVTTAVGQFLETHPNALCRGGAR